VRAADTVSDPSSLPDGDANMVLMQGLRIEAVSRTRRFVEPWTIVFARIEDGPGAGALRLLYHSVPAGAIALRAALRLWMPGAVGPRRTTAAEGHAASGDDDEDEGGQKMVWRRKAQDLQTFARAVRRAMVAMVKRDDSVGDIRQQCEARAGVTASPAGPNGSRELELVVEGAARVRMVVAETGCVERVVVKLLAEHVNARGNMIAKSILARGGRADGLVGRLMRAVGVEAA
jgi:hypothetical protein